jgi:TPR repeat protein
MYEKGQGVPQDYAEAMKWYRKAADQGYAHAQWSIGGMYFEGNGVQQNYVTAANWFRKAADQGHPKAQLLLGDMYLDGQGVPQDYVQAHKWLNLAATLGDPDLRNWAAKDRASVTAKMTKEQIAEAQKLAREWKSTAPH